MTLEQELALLRAENAKLKQAKLSQKLTFKVSDKGGVSVYGNGRFPQTLYVEQWERLLYHADELKAFIEKNRAGLATKASQKLVDSAIAAGTEVPTF